MCAARIEYHKGAHHFNVHTDFADREPWNQNANKGNLVRFLSGEGSKEETYNTVIAKANQKSCWRMTLMPLGFHEWVSRS